MAAINVAITKTLVSTTITQTVLSDTTILPIIGSASFTSFTSFLLTSKIGLLKTQRALATESISDRSDLSESSVTEVVTA